MPSVKYDERDQVTAVALSVIGIIMVGAVLKAAQSVVLPLIIAWLLSYMLGPIVTFLSRRRVPAALSVTFVLALLLGICYLAAAFLHSRILTFVAAYPNYHARFMELVRAFTSRWNLSYDLLAGVDWGPKIGEYLVRFTAPLIIFVSKLVMVIIFLVFLLLGKPYFQFKVYKAFSKANADSISVILGSISKQIGHYLVMQLLISLATGVCVWMALMLLKVDFPVTWGALAFFLNFIPTLGSIVASIPPVLLAFVQFDTIWPAIGVLVVLVTIQMVIGNGISPKVMGDRLNLSPVVVLLSLVFWGWLWGLTGALLAVPIASAIKIVCENIESLRPISTLMGSGKAYRREFGGRPPEPDVTKSA
jgi:AI-2 transport protein TqsA